MKTSTQTDVIFSCTDTNQQQGTKTGFTNTKPPTPPPSSQFSSTPKSAKSSMDAMDVTMKKRSLGYSKSNTQFPPMPYPIDPGMLEEGRGGFGGDSPYRSPSYAATPRVPQVTPKTPLMTSPGPAGGDNGGVDDQASKNIIPDLSKQHNPRSKTKSLVEWVIFGILLGCLIASLTVQSLQRTVLWSLELWKWCLLWLIIFSGLFVTKWIMHLIVFFIERNFMLKKNVLYFVHGLKHSVQFFVWLGLVLFTWVLLFSDNNVRRSDRCKSLLNYVTWTLVSTLIGSFLWFLKTLFLKILASKFHVKTFFDRIQETINHLYNLQTLSGRPLIQEAEKLGKEPNSGKFSLKNLSNGSMTGKAKKPIDMSKIHQMKREKVHAWNMKVLVNELMNRGLSTISMELDEIMEDIEEEKSSDKQAMEAALRIFKNVSPDDDNYINYDDLRKFMIKEEVCHFLSLFEGADQTGKIDKITWMNWVVKVYQEREALARALLDVKTAVRALNQVFTIILVVVTLVIWLLLTGIASTKILLYLSTQLLALGFIFKSTCKTTFESIVFVFVIHPFDVGDRCVIDGVPLLVEEMRILSTVFLKLNSEKIYYPNSVLARKPISNYQRSPEMGDTVNFTIDFATPLEKIGALKERIKKYLSEKPQHWLENHSVVVNEIENINQIKMALNVNHTINFQDFAEKNRRRTELILELKKIFEELKIQYCLLPQQIHLVDKVKEC